MKRIITICAAILMTASVFLPQQASAQAPEKMSYQAVVRDGSNALVTSTAVGMQISILQGSSTGTAVYVETQTPTSNANGLVSLEIGSGTIVSGDFTTIDWANGPYFIKTETDPNGGINYSISGVTELLSVPYALYALDGNPGPQGADGNGISSTVDNGDGTITFNYDDGSSFTTSDLTGPQGSQGVQGNGIVSTQDNGDGTFTFTYDDGSTFTTSDLTGPQGSQGIQGNGIASTQDNGDGTFTFTYDDGSTFTTSDLTGPQGSQGLQGNGIASTLDNGDGTFTFTYDDGTTFTTSDLTGPQGASGITNRTFDYIGPVPINSTLSNIGTYNVETGQIVQLSGVINVSINGNVEFSIDGTVTGAINFNGNYVADLMGSTNNKFVAGTHSGTNFVMTSLANSTKIKFDIFVHALENEQLTFRSNIINSFLTAEGEITGMQVLIY